MNNQEEINDNVSNIIITPQQYVEYVAVAAYYIEQKRLLEGLVGDPASDWLLAEGQIDAKYVLPPSQGEGPA